MGVLVCLKVMSFMTLPEYVVVERLVGWVGGGGGGGVLRVWEELGGWWWGGVNQK